MSLLQINRLIIGFLLLLFCAACSFGSGSNISTNEDGKPDWIIHSYQAGKICGVGYAKRHLKGFATQRQNAIQSAAQEIAMQMGGDLNFESVRKEVGNTDTVDSTIESVSFFIGSQKVTATIIDAWQDDYTEEIYIYMCTN